MDNYIIIDGKSYNAEQTNEPMACYKCDLYNLNVCQPIPKCINGEYVYRSEAKK